MKHHHTTDLNRRLRAPAPPRSVRWAIRLLVGLPPLALLIAAVVYFVSLGHLLRASLAPVAAAETGRQIGHEVRLGGIQLRPGALVLNDVAVSDRKTFAGSGVGVTTPRITIHYSLHDLLFDSGNAAHALGDIVIERPTALVERFTQKTFNFSDVIDVFTKKPKKPHSKPFAGRIVVRDATVHARDYVAPANLGLRPAVNTLAGVYATVDFHSENNVYFTGNGRGVDGRVTDVGLSGDASRQTAGRFRILVKVADGDAAYWSSYFAQASSVLKKATVVSGRATLDMTVTRLGSKPPPGLPVDLEGRVTVRDATVALHDPRFRLLPLSRVNGFATFTGSGLTIHGSLLGGGQPVRVDGGVFDFTNPQLAFAASSPHLDAVRLARFFPQVKLPPGIGISPAPVTAEVTGSSLNPVVAIDTTVPAVTYRGNTATDLRTRVLYANNVFLFPNATFKLHGGGQGALRVTIDSAPKTPTVQMGGRLTGVNLAALHLPVTGGRPLPLGGVADVAFLADDRSRPLSVVANVTISRPRVGRTLLRAASGRIAYSAARGLTLSRATVEALDGGVATASGTIPTGVSSPLGLSVNAAGANLTRLLSPYGRSDVGGLAYAQARVTGPLSAPQVAGRVQLYGPRFGRLAADMVTGTIRGGTDAVDLKDAIIRRYPTDLSVSGTVSQIRSQNPRLALTASLSRGYLSNVADLAKEFAPVGRVGGKPGPSALAGLPELTGLVTATAHITGRLKSPQVAAHAAVSNVLIDAYRLKQASADVAYDGRTVRVANAALLGEDGAAATARGQFTPGTGRIDAAFAAQGLDLDQFDFLIQPYADADGLLSVADGRIGGTLRAPTASATVSARGLALEGQTFAPFTVGAHFADGVLSQSGGPWAIMLLTPGAGNAQYIIDTLRLTLPTPAHPRTPKTVTVAAQIPESAPENLTHLVSALRASRFGRTPAGRNLLSRVDTLSAAPEGTIWVPSLSVSGPLQAPAVRATVGARDLAVGDSKIARLDARLSYEGGADPSAHADVTTSGLQAAGVPLQSATAQGDYVHNVVTVSRLDVHGQEAYLHGAGRADFNPNGAIDATVDASSVPLSLFNAFLPAANRLSGQVSALTVVASGPTRAANYTASVDLDQPAVTVITPATPDKAEVATRYGVDSVRSSKITLAPAAPGGGGGSVLSVNDLAAFKGGRRIATLSGTLPVALPAALGGPAEAARNTATDLLPGVPGDEPLHAALQIADLSVLTLIAPDLIDPKRTAGTLSASLDYGGPGGTPGAPRLFGQVDIANASLGILPLDTSVVNLSGRVLAQDIRVVVGKSGIKLDGGRIAVESFTAGSSKGGTLSLTGGGTLDRVGRRGGAALSLTVKDLRIDETGRSNYLAKTYNSGARGRVNGAVAITGPWDTPLIATASGAPLLVSDAQGTLPTGSSAASGPKPVYPVDPRFNVVVRLGVPGKTVSVRGPLLQAEASGDAELMGRLSDPQATAHVTVARGQFILPPTRLAIVRPEDGTVNTVDVRFPVPSPDPADNGAPVAETRVHLVARANVAVSQAVLNANQSAVGGVVGQAASLPGSGIFSQAFGSGPNRYAITARIDGLLNVPDRLTLDLSSSPGGLTRQQMLASLIPEGALQGILGGGQGAETALKQGLAEALNAVAVPTLLSPIEQSVAGALGLEDFSVDYSPNAPVNVTLSKQIAPRLLVTYIRAIGARAPGAVNSVTAPPQYTLKLGYGLTNHLQVSVSTDDQRNNTLALESIFGF